MYKSIIEVVLPITIDKTFFYYCNDESISIGYIVYVPFGKFHYYGFVINITNIYNQIYTLKECKKTVHRLSDDMIHFIKQVAHYTISSLGVIWKMVMYTHAASYSVNKDQYNTEHIPIILNQEQQNALHNIISCGTNHILLDGITGSGKTEIYLTLINQIVGQVLILVPEISLTYELLNKSRKRLYRNVYVWHSKISRSCKSYIWNQVIAGQDIVIIGTRSALFLPFSNLKLIIIDEEHDQSYKQEHGVLYHARDLALIRCMHVILVSATPSIDTLYGIKHHIRIRTRYNNNLPNIKYIKKTSQSIVNMEIINKMIEVFYHGKQSMLFLNRKGAAHVMQCTCKKILRCIKCDANMIYYLNDSAVCHYCLYTIHNPVACHKWNHYNYGIEAVHAEVIKHIPQARCMIVDSSTKKLDKVLLDIHNHNIDIIIGTQILAKGHNFQNLAFIGVLDIATQRLIDPRALEHTIQIVKQVSGRVARGQDRGDVYIESDDYLDLSDQFYITELDYRKKYNMIPFRKLISIIITSNKQKMPNFDMKYGKVYGPIEAPINKINNIYRYRILIEYQDMDLCFNELKQLKNKNMIIDTSPYYFY